MDKKPKEQPVYKWDFRDEELGLRYRMAQIIAQIVSGVKSAKVEETLTSDDFMLAEYPFLHIIKADAYFDGAKCLICDMIHPLKNTVDATADKRGPAQQVIEGGDAVRAIYEEQ